VARQQLLRLEKIGTAVSTAPQMAAPIIVAPVEAKTDTRASDLAAMKEMMNAFITEMRASTGTEMKQLVAKLSDVGTAIGQTQRHIGNSGQLFAEQMSLAASRLLNAASKLEESM